MTPWTDILVSVCMELIRLFVIKKYADLLFLKNQKIKYGWMFYLLSYILTTGAYLCFHTVIINIIVTFIGIFIITFAYEGRFIRRLLFAAMILAISAILDLLAVFMLSSHPSGDNYEIASSFISVGLFLLSSILVKRMFGRRAENIMTGYWWYLTLILLSIIITLYIIVNDRLVSRESMIFIGLTLLLLVFTIYYLYDAIIIKYQSGQENLLLREQMKVYDNQIQLNIENERRVKALRHDMRHHLKEITDLARTEKNQELIEYVLKMDDYIRLDEDVVDTGNTAIDGILNYKIAEAKKKGIAVTVHIAVPDEVTLSVFDMNIIFGNLMDNAMEAMYEIENPFIDIDIRYSQNCMFIQIMNPYNTQIVYSREGKIKSTKKEHAEHGFGIENIKRVVENYFGDISIQTEKNMFVVKIVLFITD